jgi:radical SAM protein with 4Fe4S-binding SPASM domain
VSSLFGKIGKPFSPKGVQHVTIGGMRIHMRRDQVSNMVWINGVHLLFLNNVAADFTQALIKAAWESSKNQAVFSQESVERAVVTEMHRKYSDASEATLREDFNRVFGTFLEVAKGSCPVEDLGLKFKEIDPTNWSAPARMDLALTYRCNNNCFFCYTGGPQQKAELTTKQWKKIIDRLWDIGVPQLVFTGGEPTIREDLAELVNYSQKFVTGLVTNGRRLDLLAEDLKKASLDYVQVSLESSFATTHDKMVGANGAWNETVAGIIKALSLNMEVVTNTTLTRDNIGEFLGTLQFGRTLGLKNMACNGLICSGRGHRARKADGIDAAEMKEVLQRAQEKAYALGINLQWYSPTCYNDLNPMELGLGVKSCSAAQFNMTVEPDGMVIPCQSWIHEKVGNILTESWVSIWSDPISVALRSRKHAQEDEKCRQCQHLSTCGGGCPLERLNIKEGVS